MLGIQNEREWQSFCTHVMLQADLAQDPRFNSGVQRNANRQALAAAIDAVFSKLSADQVIERLEMAQIANARVNSLADVWAHPQLQARGRWRDVGSSAGPLPALLPPGRNSAYDYRMDPIPQVGEHTQAILQELGLGPL